MGLIVKNYRILFVLPLMGSGIEKNNIIVGFGDIDDTGYFDHLFTHKDGLSF